MPNTFELIASSTVGSGGVSAITFSSIPTTYTDLCLKLSVRSSTAASYVALKVRYNNNSGSYSARQIYGNGASATSNTYTDAWVGFMNAASSTSNTFSSTEVYIPNYYSANNKSSSVDFVQEDNATTAIAGMLARLWADNGAINELNISPESGNFVQYSTAYLYGVKNA